METAIEFYVVNGKTFYIKEGTHKALTQFDKEPIDLILWNLRNWFPETLRRLEDMHLRYYKMNPSYFEFRIADRFIRCNFGEADFMHNDVEGGIFNFEEVKCPLRGICEDQGVICRPKPQIGINKEEARVVSLDIRGLCTSEIAEKLCKSEKTCKNQIWNVCKKLKLANPRWLFRLFTICNVTLID